MQDTQAFAPFYRVSKPPTTAGKFVPSVTVAATAGGALLSTQLPGAPSGPANQLQIANTGTTAWAYIEVGKFGAVVTAAVATSYPVAPGATVVISVDQEVDGASVIMSAGSASIIFTRGAGV